MNPETKPTRHWNPRTGKWMSKKALENMSFTGRPTHTPTFQLPIVNVRYGNSFILEDANGETLAHRLTEIDSNYIVRAVNAHGLLLEVAKQAIDDLKDCSCSDYKCLFCLAQEALAKAEGRE